MEAEEYDEQSDVDDGDGDEGENGSVDDFTEGRSPGAQSPRTDVFKAQFVENELPLAEQKLLLESLGWTIVTEMGEAEVPTVGKLSWSYCYYKRVRAVHNESRAAIWSYKDMRGFLETAAHDDSSPSK